MEVYSIVQMRSSEKEDYFGVEFSVMNRVARVNLDRARDGITSNFLIFPIGGLIKSIF